MLSSLALLAAAGALPLQPASAQGFDFDCEPVHLYRGDTLTVTFHSPHANADLAILNPDTQTIVISYKRAPEDKVNSVIPHDKFGKMRQVRLNTAKAQGSVMKDWAHGGNPAVLEPPQMIFTKTGNYDVVVGEDITSSNGEIDVCDLYYFDYPKPRAKRADQPPKPTLR